MKIRNRLYLIFSLFLVLLVMISFTIFRANKQINKATASAGIANGIGKNLNDLNMVAYEFLLYHEKRMQQQWYMAHTSILKLLKERNENPDSPEEAAILQSIIKDIEAIHVLFLKLNEIHGKREMRSGGNEHEGKIPSLSPLNAILASELLVKSHHATSGSLRLHAMAREEIFETQRKADSVILISMIVFTVVLLISGAFTIRSIATPISKLVEGTQLIGKGNFDYKIKVKSRDEIGELAASFNTMTQNLLAREKELEKRRDENTKLAVIAEERGELQDWINTFDTFVGKFDPDGIGIIYNEAPLKAGGVTRDELAGKHFPDTKWWSHSEIERARIVECFKKAKAGSSSRIETNIRSADGTQVPIIFNCQPVMDADGKVNYITAEGKIIVEEVKLRDALQEEKANLEKRVKERTSELVEANKKLREEIIERKQAETHIQHLQSVLKAIRNVNQLIVHEKNQEKLLQDACEILNQSREYKLIWIGLVQEGTKDVLPVAQAGFEEGYLKSIKITWDDSEIGRGPTGTAIKTQKPFIMHNIAGDPRYKPWREEAIKRGYTSSVATPLVHENRVFGALNVYADISDAFDEEEIGLLVEVAQDIAFALKNIEIEEDIKRTKEFLQSIIDNTSDLVCTVDLEGNFLSINRAVVEQMGYEEEDLIGKPKTMLAVEPELFENIFREVLEKGRLSNVELPFRRKDGTIADILYSVTLLRDKDSHPIAIAGFGKDITELKQAEKALRKAHEELEVKVAERTRELALANIRLKEVDRLKSEFLATMSHELRTPLNSIIGFTGIILKGIAGEINEEQRKQLSMVYGSSKHLLSLINDILDLSRIESGKMELSVERFKIKEVISEIAHTLSPMISQKGLRLLTEIPAETPEIQSDRKKVLQILLNLVNNAIKFTDKGEIKIEGKTDNGHLKVSVSDTGIGIKRENMDYLFESFRQIDGRAQRRYEGAGLGLYLCRKLVAILGGEIWAESEYGKGSSFTFTLALRLE